MRVASLESVLAVATLVSAAVVVLWGVKILYSMWTGRTLASKDLQRGTWHRHASAAAEVCCSILKIFPGRSYLGRYRPHVLAFAKINIALCFWNVPIKKYACKNISAWSPEFFLPVEFPFCLQRTAAGAQLYCTMMLKKQFSNECNDAMKTTTTMENRTLNYYYLLHEIKQFEKGGRGGKRREKRILAWFRLRQAFFFILTHFFLSGG